MINLQLLRLGGLMMESLSINKLYSLVAQEESNHIPTHVHVVDEAIILTNSYKAKKSYGHGGGTIYGGSNQKNSRYYINCHKYGHTVQFCYGKHAHPQVNKSTNTYNTNSSE